MRILKITFGLILLPLATLMLVGNLTNRENAAGMRKSMLQERRERRDTRSLFKYALTLITGDEDSKEQEPAATQRDLTDRL